MDQRIYLINLNSFGIIKWKKCYCRRNLGWKEKQNLKNKIKILKKDIVVAQTLSIFVILTRFPVSCDEKKNYHISIKFFARWLLIKYNFSKN